MEQTKKSVLWNMHGGLDSLKKKNSKKILKSGINLNLSRFKEQH